MLDSVSLKLPKGGSNVLNGLAGGSIGARTARLSGFSQDLSKRLNLLSKNFRTTGPPKPLNGTLEK